MKSLLILILMVITVVQLQAQQLPYVSPTDFKKDSFNITRYGAIADGITLNTKSIMAAIDDCSAKGGGVVVIPAGLWASGPITLRSNINLCVQKNAMLLFTDNKNEYAIVASTWEGLLAARNQSPLSAENASNIAITGEGIVDGNGDAWRAVGKDKLTEFQWNKKLKSGGVLSSDGKTWYPSESYALGIKIEKPGVLVDGKMPADFANIKDFLRPNLLVFLNCDKVLLEGVTFQNSAAWCLHPALSTNITVRNITVKNPWYAHNGDGIDIESCRNVLVENSSFDVGDDGLCIKSGRDEQGRKRGVPTKDVIIRNCTVYHAHGGFVIGSEMSGGVSNIYVDDCTFIGTDIGLRFKTTRGRGGVVENIFINNIIMKDIVGEAILFDMYYMAKDPIPLNGENKTFKTELLPVTEATPSFRNFTINHVVCNGAEKAIFIRGLPEMNIRDIKLNDITIVSKKGIDITEAQNVSLDNVKLEVSEKTTLIAILNSSNINFSSFSANTAAENWLRLSGEKTKDIHWKKSPALNANQLVFESGANKNALQIQ